MCLFIFYFLLNPYFTSKIPTEVQNLCYKLVGAKTSA